MIKNELDKITEQVRTRLNDYLEPRTAVDLSKELESKGHKIGIQAISNFKNKRNDMGKANLIILDEFLREKGY